MAAAVKNRFNGFTACGKLLKQFQRLHTAWHPAKAGC